MRIHLPIIVLLLIGAPIATSSNPIQHIVVLVMENRSFDHMLGWVKLLNPNIDGITKSESNPVSTSDPNFPIVRFNNRAQYVDPDPGHSFQAIREQIFGSNNFSSDPKMNRFVQQAASMSANMTEAVMNGSPPEMVKVCGALMEEFAVFDRWFASVSSSTQPNQLYLFAMFFVSTVLLDFVVFAFAVTEGSDLMFDHYFDDTLDLHIEYIDLYEKMRISTESVL